MKGDPITDLSEIIKLHKEGKSVWCEHWKRTSPAAFLMNWRLKDVQQLIDLKRIFYYNKIN